LFDEISMDRGFAIVEGVIESDEAVRLRGQIEGIAALRTRAGARHLMSVPAVNAIAHDARLTAIARNWVGASAIPYRATLFDKSPDSNWLIVWHQDTALPLVQRADTAGWGPWSLKGDVQYAHAPAHVLERIVALRLSLDDSAPDNGPLRVIPATHVRGVLTDDEIAKVAREVDAVDCCVGAGGVVVMRPLTVHASSKAVSDRPRRVLHIEYADTLDVGDGLRLRAV
jgi:ectoine hydroxylase-related dioxygenase (phytanoyl-CoA dioxygenase family)